MTAASRSGAVIALALAAALAGCGGGEPGGGAPPPEPSGSTASNASPASREPDPPPVPCPPDLDNCESAYGRVVYVEAVDPDGDRDAHFVLASRQSITAPGISVIDVRRELRPRPLPGIGDEISAAGPVYPGSYGQRQIEAIKLRVAP